MSSSLQLKIPDLEVMPNHSIGGQELICELRKTSTVLYGLFTEVVRQFYLNGRGFLKGTPDIRWDVNPDKTGIWIDSELTWNDEHPEFRPAIFVHLDPMTCASPLNISRHTTMDLVDAVYTYERIVKGQVTFTHVSPTAGEAVILCDNTEAYLNNFAAQLTKDFCFNHFIPASRTPLVQSQQESDRRYSSAVSYAFDFGEAWTVKLESPKLKVLKINEVGIFDGQQYNEHASISKNVTPPAL